MVEITKSIQIKSGEYSIELSNETFDCKHHSLYGRAYARNDDYRSSYISIDLEGAKQCVEVL